MAAFTTRAAGDWSSAGDGAGHGTWTEAGTPGNGDTATINHAVTISDARIIGTSPAAGTTVLTCTANLTISSTGSLTLRGDMSLNACQLIVNSGAFTFDASLAASPSSQKYKCTVGTADFQYGAYVTFTGSAGARCTCTSNASGGNGYFTRSTGGSGGLGIGMVRASYADFTRIGDSTNPFCNSYHWSTSSVAQYYTNCTFDYCGPIWPYGLAGATSRDCYFDQCTWSNTYSNSTHPSNSSAWGKCACIEKASGGTGRREVTNCVMDRGLNASGNGSLLITNNILAPYDTLSNCTGATFTGNLVYDSNTGQTNIYHACTDNYFVNPSNLNPHYIPLYGKTHSGWIFDGPLGPTGDLGDACFPATSGGTLQYSIVLPTTSKEASSTLASYLGGTSAAPSSLLHNTGCYSVHVGETTNTGTDTIAAFKSNIIWKPSGSSGVSVYKIHKLGAQVSNDPVSAANADYNCGYGLAAGTGGKGYDIPLSGGTPGSHDVDVNPNFVDPYRNIESWDASLGGAGTYANAMTELKKLNTSAHNSQYTVANLRAYVLAGYKPTNSLLRNAGHDGVTIGAVEGQFGGDNISAVDNLYPMIYAA